ncbi:MAG: hypothetical protein LCH73_12780 [Proteobacteria bacterium]|nr:hypothetical protein [Pseudomonadota bacterium]
MKKYIFSFIAALACAATLAIGFVFGVNRATESNLVRSNYLSTINAAASYSAHADVVELIHAQKTAKALCHLNLLASAEVNQVRTCLAAADCRKLVEEKVREIAPELSINGSLRTIYYREGELCKP